MTLLTAYSNGILGESQFRLQNEMIEKDLNAIYKEIEEIQKKLNTFNVVIDKEQLIIDGINKLACIDPTEWTNQLIKSVIDKIVVDTDKNIEVYLKYQTDKRTPIEEVSVTCDEKCDDCKENYQDRQCSNGNIG